MAEHPVRPVEAETHAGVEHGGGEAHAAPTFYGITAPMFISAAMLVVLAIIIWKKVPAAIGKALDKKIDLIRQQLAEAESLRKDAEALKAEYEKRSAAAETEAEALLQRARHEADSIVAQARESADALVERRGRMAEEKIAAEERAALDQLRATAAAAAREAAASIIRERHDAVADEALVEQAIRSIGSR
jgi:F-type H+-transporting ATPase subunit b